MTYREITKAVNESMTSYKDDDFRFKDEETLSKFLSLMSIFEDKKKEDIYKLMAIAYGYYYDSNDYKKRSEHFRRLEKFKCNNDEDHLNFIKPTKTRLKRFMALLFNEDKRAEILLIDDEDNSTKSKQYDKYLKKKQKQIVDTFPC